jgi:hypothetical protein
MRTADMQAVRSKGLWPALDGGYRLRRLATVCERQPGGQLVGSLFRGRPVERHHRRGYPSGAAELGTPTVADGRYLDVVRTPTDSFFEMMNDHVRDVAGCEANNERDFTRLSRGIKRNRSRRRRPQPRLGVILRRSHRRKISGVRFSTRFSRAMHRFSTVPASKTSRVGRFAKVECLFGLEWLEY